MNVRLPEDYKKFLMKNNGGIPETTMMFRFVERNPLTGETFNTTSDVQNFSQLAELPFFYENLIAEGVIPDKYLSVSCDSCGNEILLCADESENYGKVYFGDHEIFDPVTNYYSMSVIADTFTGFINILYSVE